MNTSPEINTPADLTPEDRLNNSRSEMIGLMQQPHPMLQLVQPIVTSYATVHPFKTLAISAGLGAAVVILKPWRLITLSGLLAVIKARR